MRITGFEWDDGNVLHLALGHGIEAEEAEEVFAVAPVFRRTKRSHFVVLGPALSGRLLVMVFERQSGAMIRVITGWDMSTTERRYYQRQRRR